MRSFRYQMALIVSITAIIISLVIAACSYVENTGDADSGSNSYPEVTENTIYIIEDGN